VALLTPYTSPPTQVLLEESQAMPGQGTRSMGTIGLGMGVWLGMLATLGLAHPRVRPGVWKQVLGLGKDKAAARLKARQLSPGADLRRKQDHGRAEALLLAYWGQRPHAGGSTAGAVGRGQVADARRAGSS